MLGQYNRNTLNGTEELQSARGMQKMVSSVGQLEVGNIFEGTVNSVKGGKVLLALGNGQMVTAQMDGKVNIQVGTSMFFQVKSNDGETVAIRPYTGVGNTGNPILLNALTTAGIPVNERNFAMVDAMMQEQMPVGKQSLLDMVRILNANPDVKVATLVQMTRMGIPVNAQNAAQFENYMSDSHAIMGEMDTAMNQITSVFSGTELTGEMAAEINGRILDVLAQEVPEAAAAVSEGSAAPENGTAVQANMTLEQNVIVPGDAAAQSGQEIAESAAAQSGMETVENAAAQSGQEIAESTAAQSGQETAGNTAAQNGQEIAESTATQTGQAIPGSITAGDGQVDTAQLQEELRSLAAKKIPLTGEPLGQLFTEPQLAHLTRLLQNVPALAGDVELFPNLASDETVIDTMSEQSSAAAGEGMAAEEGTVAIPQAALDKNMDAGEFLMAVRRALSENGQIYGYLGAEKLFSSREYRTALRNVMEQQWLVKPEELRQENKVNELYNRLDAQMRQMEDILRAAGTDQQDFHAAATDVRNNIDFMNQINQIYNYVQIPLKMAGQNANSELYVYTNRKALNSQEGELTAFLHLDLENLGSTDVSVKLMNKNVRTDFYLKDESSYNLVEKHLPILEKHLKNKGYLCKVTISRERVESANFVENIREKEQTATGTLHRYSFDVKA
jgi:hypothetical protein